MSKRITGYSAITPKSLTSGAGVVFENFDLATDTYEGAEAKKVGATTGGVKVKVEHPGKWTREIDGLPENTVGMDELEFIKPTVTFSIVEVSNASRLKKALGAADVAAADKPTGYQVVTPRADLTAEDYPDNLAIFVRTKAGEPLIIVIDNPLSTEGFEFATESKAGGAIEVTYTGNFDPLKLDEMPIKFYVPTPAV
jgi:hypothetical protein